jgi:glycosyltransferase involved in cell wall biosynthesis
MKSDQTSEQFRLYGIEPPYILSVGHLLDFRNFLELIEGFAIVRRECGIKNWQLVLAGREQVPGYWTRIRASMERYQVSDTVRVLGGIPHDHVGALLRGCELFAFPSSCENCPTSLIEAMSVGLPICCSNVGVMPEIARDSVVYFNPHDPKEIAGKLRMLIESPELRRELGQRAFLESRRFPDAAEVARRTIAVIEDVGRSKPRLRTPGL